MASQVEAIGLRSRTVGQTSLVQIQSGPYMADVGDVDVDDLLDGDVITFSDLRSHVHDIEDHFVHGFDDGDRDNYKLAWKQMLANLKRLDDEYV